MHKDEVNIVETALQLVFKILDLYKNEVVYHDRRYVSECVACFKEICKHEEIKKEDYEKGIVALILNSLMVTGLDQHKVDIPNLISNYYANAELTKKDEININHYLEFLHKGVAPQNRIEMAMWDSKDIVLAMPDSLERLNLLRSEHEKVFKKSYSDLEWEQYCKQYYINHTFYTEYAINKYGSLKTKNYLEIEKRIDHLKEEATKNIREHLKMQEDNVFSSKEREDLFKIAFRNYLNLVSLADRKAHILIQINSILFSVIIGFTVKRGEYKTIFLIPSAILLVGAGLTILFAIMASKPLERFIDFDNTKRETFFFGSFDRLDPNFYNVSWEKYSKDINELFLGDKKNLFEQIIQESYLVRKVLSKKFGYISCAYKIFIGSIGLAITVSILLLTVKF